MVFLLSFRLFFRLGAVIQTEHTTLLAHMGLQKPSVMAGKATIRLVDYDDDDVAASAAAGIDDGEDEHVAVSLGRVAEHTTKSVGVVEHIAVQTTVSLEIVSLGQGGCCCVAHLALFG